MNAIIWAAPLLGVGLLLTASLRQRYGNLRAFAALLCLQAGVGGLLLGLTPPQLPRAVTGSGAKGVPTPDVTLPNPFATESRADTMIGKMPNVRPLEDAGVFQSTPIDLGGSGGFGALPIEAVPLPPGPENEGAPIDPAGIPGNPLLPGGPIAVLPKNGGIPGIGTPSPKGPADALGGSLFGALPPGRVVYVIDCSGSMGNYGRMDRVITELRSIFQSAPMGTEFQVIFFANGVRSWVGDAAKLEILRKSPETMQQLDNALNAAVPKGGTVPMPALLKALSLEPDVMFFLTDGDFRFTDDDLRDLRQADVSGAIIHGTLIDEQPDEPLPNNVRKIAETFGGKVRYVNLGGPK